MTFGIGGCFFPAVIMSSFGLTQEQLLTLVMEQQQAPAEWSDPGQYCGWGWQLSGSGN